MRRRQHAEPLVRYHARIVLEAVGILAVIYAAVVAVSTGLAR